ncbi:hypothetical protein H5410_051040 [Solanum commersonii]|uniref:Uncharacterized protein n=1 Tax=Solanum commersonii TaxID=4109 RepID=A0A9J5WYT6_SOLCO|nr:hypothetical protein H5410_051040 [Solanum commersonii]
MDFSVSDVWVIDCTTISSRSSKSLYRLSSLISISSSSISASDSLTDASSLCTSHVVAEGTYEVLGVSKSFAASSNEVESVDVR